MKLAAIDIGSNSIHMIVARIDGDGSLEIIDRQKEMARLGEETLVTGFLSEEAQDRGITALRKLKQLADSYKVDDIIAVATSATRESRNGADFISRVADECQIEARIITGVEEGRLIYLGTREVYPFGSSRALIIDIGGGSVELIVADQRRELLIQSLKLGVRRLKDRFLSSDPPGGAEVSELYEHVRTRSDAAIRAIRRVGFDTVIATSGTANTLIRLCNGLMPHLATEQPGRVSQAAVAGVADRLVGMSAAELDALTMIDDRRRDTVTAGAILMRQLLESLNADGYTFCDAALREGMIVDYLERNRPELRLESEVPDVRRRSVLLLARRLYFHSIAHPQTVARLAVRLFDDLRPVHKLLPEHRELLEYAALLHNVGTSISRSSHHKHSLYIVRHADLQGFTDRERLIMANVARYHRGSGPKARHLDFMELDAADREIVKRLSALLRLANAMDRGHRGNVHTVNARVEGDSLKIQLMSFDDPALETNAVRQQREYIEMVYGLDLSVSTLGTY
jgi:exopolyphosphatase/guanosine-5'-triphosphate,3'-diphosphate pyrophosphatase